MFVIGLYKSRCCRDSHQPMTADGGICLRSNILWIFTDKKRLVIAEDDVCYRKFTELYESGFF